MTEQRGPRRIQRRRTAGWRMPPGAIYVGRPGYWGNPFHAGHTAGWHFEHNRQAWNLGDLRHLDDTHVLTYKDAVNAYRKWVTRKVGRSGYYMSHEAQCELAGKDLACWCPEGQACHATVLLELANGVER